MSAKFRKFVSVLLACVMIFSLCGLTAFAEDNTEPTATKNADVSETPATADPTAAVTEAPKSEETPATVETAPTAEETPANVTESPKASESPAESEAPKGEVSPAASETPAATAAPTEVAPSVRITGSETAGGVTVNVDAPEGAFPAGTTLKITPISGIKNFLDIPMNKIENSLEDELADSSDLTGAVAFDITFIDQNGKEIQPDAAYSVSVTFTVEDAADALGDPDRLQAFHMENISDKNPQAVSAPVDVKPDAQNEVKVDATQFSIYVIAGQKAPKTITYQFHVGSNIVSTQIVKKGDTLNQPESPATESGKAFKGWFSAAEGGEAFTGFGIVDEIAESETIDLFAQYTEGFTVTYMDNSGRAFKTMLVSKNGNADLSVKFDVDATHSVTGWAASEADAAAGTALKAFTVNADVTLYPIIRSGHWLTFDTNGGSPIDPQFVADGSMPCSPENDPVRTGYDFKGWYTASTGNSKYSFKHTLSNNETAYAQWTGKKVSFTINYWKETLTDGEYAFIESSSGSANAGDTVSARTNAKNYKYFTYNSAKSNDVTVNADGTTVLNIYYTRNTYTFKFFLNGGSSTGTSYTTMTINGVTYYNNRSEYYTFSAKYGADISSLWPTKANIGISKDTKGHDRTADANKFHGWQLNGRGTCFSSTCWNVTDEMISNDANNAVQAYYGSWSNNLHSVTLHYYLQNVTDDQYTEYAPYTQKANTSGSFDAKDIAGFTHVAEKDHYEDPVYSSLDPLHLFAPEYYKTYNFYYSRNRYNISFNTNGGTVPVPSIQAVKFGAALDGYSLPVSYQEGTTTKTISGRVYTFAGWYTGTDTKVTSFSGMTMPQSGLLLTAKWTTDEINVTFDYNDGKTPPSVVPVGYNETVSEPATPTRDGYRFAGWMKDENAYNFAAKVASSFTLTAKWIKNGNLTVIYNANGGTGSVSDAAKYAEGAAAKVLPGSGLTAPGGKLFIGWTDKAGALYYPGQFIELRADLIESNSVTLTAKWADPKETTTVTYKAGDGTGSDYQLTYAINEGFALYNNQNPDHLFTKPGYAFNGWSDGTNTYTLADISSNTYGADNQQIIPNVLTAQWRKLAIVSYDANGGSGTMASQTVAEDNTIAVSGNSFTRAAYTFTGWNTKAGGTGTPYAPGAILTATADLILYAQWSAIDKLGFYIRNDGKVQPEGALYSSSYYTTVEKAGTQTFDYTKAGVSFSTGSNPSLYVTGDGTVRSALTTAGNAIPTAEAVFNACKNSIATFDGGTIDYANLTAAEFARDYEIQWYVLKCQVNDSWHVDGVIVKKPTYTVTTKITNGTITPTATVNYNGTVNVTYSASPGYYISSINVDGSSVSTSTYANGYIFSNVKANHSIEVVCTAYGGGYVEPSTSPTSIPDSEPPKDDKPSTSPSAPASSGTTIPDDDVPQGDRPSANIPDDDTPTADTPVTIPDGSTPTAAKPATPKTGDNSHATLFSILAAVSAAGLAAIGIVGKKRKQNEGK